MKVKRLFWDGYLQKKVNLICKVCPYGKVITFYEGDTDPTPWDLWGRIFQLFTNASIGHQGWRIGFFAWNVPRILPSPSQEIELGPEYVNGGYAYPCKPNSIIIYRIEEATRVLVHELFHASCCDRKELPLVEKEAETEAWAEWLLIAIASRGNQAVANELFEGQLQWMGKTHATLRKYYGITGEQDYIWRYTIGREKAYERLGYSVPEIIVRKPQLSSRLTSPMIDLALKRHVPTDRR